MPLEFVITSTPTSTHARAPRADVTGHQSDVEGNSKLESGSDVPRPAFVPNLTPFELRRRDSDEADPKRWSEAGSRFADNLRPSRTPSRPPSRTPSPSQGVASPTQSQEGRSGKVTDSVNGGDQTLADESA